jgi:hypothetical protein
LNSPSPPLSALLEGCAHEWDDDPHWPLCAQCGKSKLFLEMIEEVLRAVDLKKFRETYARKKEEELVRGPNSCHHSPSDASRGSK